ncbi:MAG: endopeptidase La [Lachnospiraceae bacterium]|nr:endopeptidase La [Lachnospiraceae bacterium]
MDYTKIMPMLTLRGKIVFPHTAIYFDVSRKKSISALEEAMSQDQMIFLTGQVDPNKDEPKREDIYDVGTIARIKQLVRLPQGLVRILAEGVGRGRLLEICESEPFFRVEVMTRELDEREMNEKEQEAFLQSIKDALKIYASENPKFNENLLKQMMDIDQLEVLVDELATNLPIHILQKQMILETLDLSARAEKLLVMLNEEIEILEIRKDLQGRVKQSVDKGQKDYILREQMKVIREELGEENIQDDAGEYREKTEQLKASKEVKEKLLKEIKRFQGMPAAAAESSMIRGYIETLLDMPWNKSSKDNKDIKKAIQILEEDHYGLTKVKERIVEFLAVRALTRKGEAPIICLVGPPGTGKTSIARSIARAMNKKYVRISLGGIRDEAEIRGHRRTYVGAMPGRIVEAIRQAKVKNPLLLLDEIDKVSSDYKGDTASALLEVLDGEQNVNFRDHYLELPLDLSDVFFVATANDLETIPRPLLDRMEIIEVNSYTENEKFHIACKYLIPKQIEKNGLKEEHLLIENEAVYAIIRSYTREAGVRELERKIGQIARRTARKMMEEERNSVTVTEENLKEFLGTPIYVREEKQKKPEIGIVTGLAWTPVGGDTLSIEVNIMPGKGEFELTGRLGDVMKESARAGISYIRSVSSDYQIEPSFFEKNDIHIHIPEGAVPKDGPSAGITMATAMLSAITKIPVRGDLAMTGEITLRGRVLPIGGLKEKILAAKVEGIQEILVPVQNQKDVRELEEEIISGVTITYVSQMEEVIKKAFTKSL